MNEQQHETYMKEALSLARKAAQMNEVPVGAIIVRNGEIIAQAANFREQGHDATAHAETLAIRAACQSLGTWRLSDCELYVTLEPCPMCAGAIVNSRIKRVIYGVKDARGGAMGSVMNLCSYPLFFKPDVIGGICEEACREVLHSFFEKQRNREKKITL